MKASLSANGDMQIKCPQCEKPVNFVYCPYCGAEQGASQSAIEHIENHYEGQGTLAAALKPNAPYLRAALPAKYHHFFDNVLMPLAERGAESLRPVDRSSTMKRIREYLKYNPKREAPLWVHVFVIYYAAAVIYTIIKVYW